MSIDERITVIKEVLPLGVFRDQARGIGWTDNELCNDQCFLGSLMSRFAKHATIKACERPFQQQQLNAKFGPTSDQTVNDYVTWLEHARPNGLSRGSRFLQVRSAERGTCRRADDESFASRDRLYEEQKVCFLQLKREKCFSVFTEEELLSSYNEAFTKFETSHLSNNAEWEACYPRKQLIEERDRFAGLSDLCRLIVFFFGLGCLPRILLGLDHESFYDLRRFGTTHGLTTKHLRTLEDAMLNRYYEAARFKIRVKELIEPNSKQLRELFDFVKYRKRGELNRDVFVVVDPSEHNDEDLQNVECVHEVIDKVKETGCHTRACPNHGQALGLAKDEVVVLVGIYIGRLSAADLRKAMALEKTEQVYALKYSAINKIKCCLKAECKDK